MSDLEKVLKIAEEIEAERIGRIEDVLTEFMHKKYVFALENLDPWLLHGCSAEYQIDELGSPISPNDLEQAAKNLGFVISLSGNKSTFIIRVQKENLDSKISYAKKLLNDYESSFKQETERITNLVEKYYDDLMSKISNKDVRVKKTYSSWEISVTLEHPDSNFSFNKVFSNLMESKGFRNIQLLDDGCCFKIPIENEED